MSHNPFNPSDATWSALAGEYLQGAQTAQAVKQSLDLGRYVENEVWWSRTERVYVLDDAAWVAVDDDTPYADEVELFAAIDRSVANPGATVGVSALHCEHPTWTAETNVQFRIWHDTAHHRHQLGFSTADELQLFGLQAVELFQDLHGLYGEAFAHQTVAALFCESVYQLSAYVVLGGYPDEQRVVELGPVGRRVCNELVIAAEQRLLAGVR